MEDIFKKVEGNLKIGIPIIKTLKDVKVTSSTFYSRLSNEQKRKLYEIRVLKMRIPKAGICRGYYIENDTADRNCF